MAGPDGSNNQNMAVHTTFESMGVQENASKASVVQRLLLANACDNNLLTNIANVNYLEGHRGRTHLQPLDGLPAFVDDIFIFGYLKDTDIQRSRRGRILCKSDVASDVTRNVGSLTLKTMGSNVKLKIVQTVATRPYAEGSIIRATVNKIERDTKGEAITAWKKQNKGANPAGLFVVKADVSNICMDNVLRALVEIRPQLLQSGYDLFAIDVTQDFSGTLDREALVKYLCTNKGFKTQGNRYEAMSAPDALGILENSKRLGNHVCTWTGTNQDGYTTRTKIYNKVISNFEAGKVQANFGCHLADYVYCPDKHLRQTFQHEDVQARGCTRIEVTLYGCTTNMLEDQLSNDTNVVSQVLRLVSPDGYSQERKFFVVQPPKQQWTNLASCLKCCLVLANRPSSEILVAWYAHTRTGRVVGVRIPVRDADNDQKWDIEVRRVAADYGFRDCPIFRMDILILEKENIEIAPLKCYKKSQNSTTIIPPPSNKRTNFLRKAPDPKTLLPETPHVLWTWKSTESPESELLEENTDINISTLFGQSA